MFGIGVIGVIGLLGCNSNSEQQLLLLKIGVFGFGHREQLFGFGVLAAGHTRLLPGSSPDFFLLPGGIPCPGAAR